MIPIIAMLAHQIFLFLTSFFQQLPTMFAKFRNNLLNILWVLVQPSEGIRHVFLKTTHLGGRLKSTNCRGQIWSFFGMPRNHRFQTPETKKTELLDWKRGLAAWLIFCCCLLLCFLILQAELKDIRLYNKLVMMSNLMHHFFRVWLFDSFPSGRKMVYRLDEVWIQKLLETASTSRPKTARFRNVGLLPPVFMVFCFYGCRIRNCKNTNSHQHARETCWLIT